MDVHPVTLTGKFVRLEPLSLEHVPGLASIGLHESIWRYMLYGSMTSQEDMQRLGPGYAPPPGSWRRPALCRNPPG
jgi:hypothetical protein